MSGKINLKSMGITGHHFPVTRDNINCEIQQSALNSLMAKENDMTAISSAIDMAVKVEESFVADAPEDQGVPDGDPDTLSERLAKSYHKAFDPTGPLDTDTARRERLHKLAERMEKNNFRELRSFHKYVADGFFNNMDTPNLYSINGEDHSFKIEELPSRPDLINFSKEDLNYLRNLAVSASEVVVGDDYKTVHSGMEKIHGLVKDEKNFGDTVKKVASLEADSVSGFDEERQMNREREFAKGLFAGIVMMLGGHVPFDSRILNPVNYYKRTEPYNPNY